MFLPLWGYGIASKLDNLHALAPTNTTRPLTSLLSLGGGRKHWLLLGFLKCIFRMKKPDKWLDNILDSQDKKVKEILCVTLIFTHTL